MSKEEKTPNVWWKVGKLFLEFLVAAVTALIASFSGSAMGLW